jgi:hypothetical protein
VSVSPAHAVSLGETERVTPGAALTMMSFDVLELQPLSATVRVTVWTPAVSHEVLLGPGPVPGNDDPPAKSQVKVADEPARPEYSIGLSSPTHIGELNVNVDKGVVLTTTALVVVLEHPSELVALKVM